MRCVLPPMILRTAQASSPTMTMAMIVAGSRTEPVVAVFGKMPSKRPTIGCVTA